MGQSTQPVATGGECSLSSVQVSLSQCDFQPMIEKPRKSSRSSQLLSCACHSKAGITEVFEGHHGPVTGLSCHSAGGPVDFSHLFISSSFDWTVKLWSTKVRHSTVTISWSWIL